MARGRRALDVDTTPGKVLLLALLAVAPIGLAFILVPILTGARPPTGLVRLVLFGTPVLAAWSLAIFLRAAPERRAHRAARIGALLDGVGLAMWVLVLVPALQGRA